MIKKIYVGCSLATSPVSYLEEILELKRQLKQEYEVLEFLGKTKGTHREVFVHDIQCVLDCDIFLAECSYPSIGLGYELATAVNNNKTVIAIAKMDVQVSRLVQGIAYDKFFFYRYNSPKEILKYLQKHLKTQTKNNES